VEPDSTVNRRGGAANFANDHESIAQFETLISTGGLKHRTKVAQNWLGYSVENSGHVYSEESFSGTGPRPCKINEMYVH